jgi:hypothetical protein
MTPLDRDRDERRMEDELRELGAHVEYPQTPDLARTVRSRIDEEASPSRGGRFWARFSSPSLAVAAALVLLVALPIFSPAARDALDSLFASGSGAGGSAAQVDDRVMSPSAGSQASKAESATEAASGSQTAGPRNDRTVPDVVGLPVLAACEKLSSRGYAGYVIWEVEAAIEPGRVVSQEPRAGHTGNVGGPVDLAVSTPYPKEKIRRESRNLDFGCRVPVR